MKENEINPTPAPEPKKAKRTRGEVNRAHLAEVANARKVAAAATDAANTAGLTSVEMDTTLPAQINALATKIENNLGKLVGTRAGKKVITRQEVAAREALMEVISPIQTAAKRVFKGDTQKLREAYYINTGLADKTLEEVQNAARGIHARLIPGEKNAPPQDTLPGVKPGDKIQALADAVATYGGKSQQQGEQQAGAEQLRETIQADIATLAGLRHDVQLAAEQAWPFRTFGASTTRKAFLLPTDRPLTK